MANQTRAATILQTLQETHSLPRLVKPKSDPFETLVITIISQNTADTNTERAFEALSNKFEITPQALAKAETGKSKLASTLRACTGTKPKQ